MRQNKDWGLGRMWLQDCIRLSIANCHITLQDLLIGQFMKWTNFEFRCIRHNFSLPRTASTSLCAAKSRSICILRTCCLSLDKMKPR